MRILLADDHALVRHAIRTILELEPNVRVVGEASNGQEAVRLTRELLPDVVLMDIRMPVMNGIDATRAIRAEHPRVGVIGVSMHEDMDPAMRDAGSTDYVAKSATPEELIGILRDYCRRMREDAYPAAA